MQNEITKTNVDGNIILDEKVDGAGVTQTIKYGLIKLMGEKQERRVSMKTILDINKAKEANFGGQINIPELNMSVQASQIVMLRSETETIRKVKDYTKLPTETIYLDKNFNILKGIRSKIERENDLYYIATCHYVETDDGKEYYVGPEQVPYLLTMVRDIDPSFPHIVKKATKYGIDIMEIHRAQQEKEKKK